MLNLYHAFRWNWRAPLPQNHMQPPIPRAPADTKQIRDADKTGVSECTTHAIYRKMGTELYPACACTSKKMFEECDNMQGHAGSGPEAEIMHYSRVPTADKMSMLESLSFGGP